MWCVEKRKRKVIRKSPPGIGFSSYAVDHADRTAPAVAGALGWLFDATSMR